MGLCDADREARHGCNRGGKLPRSLENAFRLDDVVYESRILGFSSSEASSGHDELLRQRRSDLADKSLDSTPGEGDTKVDLRDGEDCVLCRDPEITRSGENDPTSDDRSVERRDGGLGNRLDGCCHIGPELKRGVLLCLVGCLDGFGQRGDINTSAERLS